MRISRQSFERRSGKFILDLISKAMPMSRHQSLSPSAVGRMLLTMLAALFLLTAMSLSARLGHTVGSVNTINSDVGDAPPWHDLTRLPRSGPPNAHANFKISNVHARNSDDNRIEGGSNSLSISYIDPLNFQKKTLTPPKDSLFIVFYNLFIPNDSTGADFAINVVLTEQLGQVASSLKHLEEEMARIDSSNRSSSAVVFYNLIGNEYALPPQKMDELCHNFHPGLLCQRINHYQTASESVTLQDIYEFCQNDDDGAVSRTDKDTRVVYMHSKGSYHNTPTNKYWRTELTKSVLHPDCLFPPDDMCDVCGTSFYTRFSLFYPGNMWTAKCSYIRKLLPPKEGGEYDKLKKESVIKFFKLRLWGHLNSTLFEDRVDYFGLGRYRLEHWIGSHPSIQPCEVHKKNVTLAHMIQGKVEPNDYAFAMGPRRENAILEVPHAKEALDKDPDAQFHEYFYLPGNLIKWFTLYGSNGVPAQNSWVWSFFPGGDRWKGLVQKYGENAVDEMVKQSSPQFHSAFSTNNYETNHFQFEEGDDKLFSDSKEPLVVFYHISFLAGRRRDSLLALKTQFDLLNFGQYDIVTRNHDRKRPVILYYTITGGSSSDIELVSNLCKAKSKRITCRKLGQVPSVNVKGETLHQLHNFCSSKPSLKVSYLTNQLPLQYGVNKTDSQNIQKIRAYTTAATSKMCLRSRDTCNVCGMEFYPLPFNHFSGNMFAASCEYINNLMPPEKFEGAMNNLIGDALILHLERAFSSELFRFTPQNLGLEHYSVEHWIGSHPDFKPCDVAPVRRSWFSFLTGSSFVPNDFRSSLVYDFLWSLAPRRSSAPPGQLNEAFENRAIKKDDIAFLEYFFLAGNLHRWYRLYNEAPSVDSWVWQWFPRGKEWRQGVEKFGSTVVEELTKPYTDEGVPH